MRKLFIMYALNITYCPALPHFRTGILDVFSRICLLFSKCIKDTDTFGNSGRASSDFRLLLSDHESLISRICFGFAQTREQFEDLRQDALINIWQGLRSYRGDSSIRTWIYRVTLNSCVSNLRCLKKEIPTESLESLYEVVEEEDDHRRLIGELHRRISRLSPTDKAIVLMWLDEFNYEEIASVCGLTRNTIATRLRRAKEKLKEMKSESI